MKAENAKEQISSLVRGLSLNPFDRDELLTGVDVFWTDKAARNRLVHDEWYPSVLEIGEVGIRGITRTKTPELVFGKVDISELWALARRFSEIDGLFSPRAYCIRSEYREEQSECLAALSKKR